MIVGIDVSKDKLDVHISSTKKHFVIKNTKASIKGFFKNQVNIQEIELVVFEPTGGYERALHSYMLEQETPYHRAHPFRVKKFAEGKGFFAKTDKIDAHILARYGQQDEIVADHTTTQEQLKIQEYSARRSQLKDMMAREKQRLKVIVFDKEITRSIKRNIKQLQNELHLITNKLNKLIEAEKGLQEKRLLLQTAKGVGPELATLLVTDLPELGHASREQISHLVGVAPRTKDSGKKSGHRSISKGRCHVRKVLYMAALVAIRCDPRMKAIYSKLVAKGKLKKVALVAVMRKMIIMLNAMVKKNTPWQAAT